jgi:geranylgeranylglycerol-phosphate geranylgeranyltransferase
LASAISKKVRFVKITSVFHHLKTVLDLIRLRNAFISFFGVYIGAMVFSLGMPIHFSHVLRAAISAALVLGAGNALNDYFDLEIDRVNRPKRPIPSGRITRSDAFMLAMAFFLIGLGLAKSINKYCLAIALINTVMLILYAKYGKKLLLLSNLSISYLVASVFVYGAAAVYSPLMWLNPEAIKLTAILTVCAFLINLSREIVKDIEDIDGDSRAYSMTLPIKYGADNAKKVAFLSAMLTVAVSLVPVMMWAMGFNFIGFNEAIYALFIVLTDLIIVASFTTPPTINQRLLVSSMALALLAFLLGVSTPTIAH